MNNRISIITNKLHIFGYPDSHEKRIVVAQGVLPEAKQKAIVEVVVNNLTRFGEPQYNLTHNGTAFLTTPPFGDGIYGVHQGEFDGTPQVEVFYAPYRFLGGSTVKDRNGKSVHKFSTPSAPVKIAFRSLKGSEELLFELTKRRENERENVAKSELSEAGLDPERLETGAISRRLAETTMRSRELRARGGRDSVHMESVDSMLQEFGDTTIDFMETETIRHEDRFSVEARDYFKDDSDAETRFLNMVRDLLFDGTTSELRKENIVLYHNVESDRGPFIALKAENGVVYRIERLPRGQITNLIVISQGEGKEHIPPIEITGLRGLREFFTDEVMENVFPRLDRKKEEEKVNWGISKLADILANWDLPSRRAYVSQEELSSLILS